MKKVFITGISGFIGSNLALYLKDDFKIFGTYYRNKIIIPDCYAFKVELFAQEAMASLIKKIKPDFIINASGVNDFAYCQSNPRMCDDINANICRYLIGLAELIPSRFILLSSGDVYNGVKGNYVEQDKLMPTSVFGRSKKSAEILTAKYSSRSTILRLSNIYGLSNALNLSFFNKIIIANIKKEPIPLSSNLYRSHLYVKDLAEAIKRILYKKPKYLVYNLGGMQKTNEYDVGSMFYKQINNEALYIMKEEINNSRILKIRGADNSLNSERFYGEYNFEPSTIEQAVKDSIKAIKGG